MLLDNFKNDSLYSKTLVYWYEEWGSCSDKVKNGSIGIDIVNIHIVLSDVINEYELNKFESENNRKVYIKLIEKFISESHIKLYRDELLILKESLEKKQGQTVYIIAKELSKKFSQEKFVQKLFDELFIIIHKKLFSKKDRIKIKSLTKDIIVELVNLGMDIADIRDLLKNAFDTYQINEEEPLILFKYTPSDLSPSEAKEYIDNLSIEDRINIFKNNLLPQKRPYFFIFPVWGMLAPTLKDDKETIFGFHVYNPTHRKIVDDNWFDEEFKIQTDEETNDKYISKCNALINIHAVSNNVAKKIAEEKFLIFLRLVNLRFANKYKEIYWDGQYIGNNLNSKQGYFGTVFGIDRDDKDLRRNLSRSRPLFLSDLKYQKLKDYSKVIDILQERNMYIESKSITNAIELMSKSIWETDENKLLNYWICLESLANISKRPNESKFDFIKETVSNMYFIWEKFKPIHELFSLTDHYSIRAFAHDESINIPEEFLKDVGIYEARSVDSKVSLVNFYKRMNELKSFVSKESFLDIIEDTLDFYQENKTALQILRIKKDEVKLTIDYIYKSRNQIVHNGYIAKNLIPYLVNFAEGYAVSLFDTIVRAILEGELDLQNYFIKEHYEGILLEKKLSSSDFFEIGLGK
ncbi:hypothetical protein [Lysinibacillus fusiformis]|uniref:hypothetical protein n=1 Tax=Lysinibacillus fusiformis TaxID=28031 RepID=UPI000882A4BB|nr:hypothetical protein [Lysinibacillus fusiformis]SCX63423.1 hypothetical protein SAMN02787108_03252 [Lysinibacillus fusiformis]SDB46242.1 hypothetical protein SAMN02787070_03447 [Lysinibacillus fusiformis]SFI72993.1 hypothetical protein SAMN02787080_03466 [Lysinibacillus fusiformis]SFT15718.1 hypothetical protein SAMN02787099_03167 [Lysinibacillus fusiformis]